MAHLQEAAVKKINEICDRYVNEKTPLMMILSDMPQTSKGSWFLHYKDKMDPELITTIEGTVYKIWQTKQHVRELKAKGKPIPSYLRNRIRYLDRDRSTLAK